MTDQVQNATWNEMIAGFPEAHVLQTYEWAYVKYRHGWKPLPQIWMDDGEIKAAALVLEREHKLPFMPEPLRVLYVPKGPLLRDWEDMHLVRKVIGDLQTLALTRKAILIKIDPDVVYGWGAVTDVFGGDSGKQISIQQEESSLYEINGLNVVDFLRKSGWRYSREQIQYRNTVISDLRLSENEILEQMKQKTRYNIRLAEKKGVRIRIGSENDFPVLYEMYQETATRDGFLIREREYYETVWGTFISNEMNFTPEWEDKNLPEYWRGGGRIKPDCKIFIAEVEGEPVAGIVVLLFGKKAWYFYGMSTGKHRDKMPNYLLHWRAICSLKEAGVEEYDWWGAPDVFSESDAMYGVYRFKEGFGGRVCRHIGAWDYPTSGLTYLLYQEGLPFILKMMKLKRSITP